MFHLPGLEPGPCARFQLLDDLVGDAGIDVLTCSGRRFHECLPLKMNVVSVCKKPTAFGRTEGKGPKPRGRSVKADAMEGTALHGAKRRKSGRQPKAVAWPPSLDGP